MGMGRLRELAVGIAVAVGVSAATAACGADRPRPSMRPSLAPLPGFTEGYSSPASFRYHPRDAAPLLSRVSLPDGRALLAGQRGERWVISADKVAEASAELAPEDLVAIVPRPEGGFVFLGRSGTAYETAAPLGPFLRASAPLEPLVRARAAGKVLVGLKRDGTLVRSDTSLASWSKVGPDAVRFQDVTLTPDGHGLALAVPEALFQTSDFGASWQKVDAPTLGARALTVDDSGAVVVAAALGAFRFTPNGTPSLAPAPPVMPRRAEILGAPPPLGPSAMALASDRAVLLGEEWLELRPQTEPGAYHLVRGTFGQPLAETPFPVARGCQEVRLTAAGSVVVVACARLRPSTVNQSIELHRSTDGGRTFKVEPYVIEGRMSELSIATSSRGDLLVSGICPAAAGGPGCRPAGVHVRTTTAGDSGTALALVPSATPSLAGTVLALAFSENGKTAFALGRRSKSDSLAVFVSHDGGATFAARDVESLVAPDDDGIRGRAAAFAVDSLAVAEDGTAAFVVSRGGRRQWLVVDDDGRTLALAKPPVDGARIGAVGQRAVAFDPGSRETWESLDAGASWTRLARLPVDPCGNAAECAAVACVARGCVFGDVFSRIGWRPKTDAAVLVAPPSRSERRATPRVGVPYVCRTHPGDWRVVDGALGPPGAPQAAIGKAAWYVVRQDPTTSMVEFVSARRGPEDALDRSTLLGVAKKPAGVAYAVALQIEGAVALRYAVPEGAKSDPTLRQIEVAWTDVLAGHSGRAVIPSGGPYRPGDYGRGSGGAQIAMPALVSIASGGVYVRLHAGLRDEQETYFVDGHTVETLPAVHWPPDVARTGHSEMVHVGRAHVPLRLDDATVVRATRGNTDVTFDAVTVSAVRPKDFGWVQAVSVGYSGDRAGRTVSLGDPAGKFATSVLYPFRADGPVLAEPIRLPTQLDVPFSPRPCDDGERKTTPRTIAPSLPGTRHPVIVTDAIEPKRLLLTDDAVLHGSPASPCVAAYEAVLVSTEIGTPTQGETAILPVDALDRAFLFRARAKNQNDVVSGIEYRSMSCALDATAEIPIEVYRERDTLVDPE
jgi:photosystem II stability/assembly factor-like uncharacterized protein